MTTVNIHGILGHEFKSSLQLLISKPKEVFDALSSNFALFRKRINELSLQGIHYSLVVDGENIQKLEQLSLNKTPKVIDLIPAICGSGPFIAVVGLLMAGSSAFVGGATATFLLQAGMAIASVGLQMALAPKPQMQRPESTVSGAKQSFMISSKANLMEQGSPVPVGYGRLRVGSYAIQSTIKSYPQRYKADDALAGDNKNGVAIVTKGT